MHAAIKNLGIVSALVFGVMMNPGVAEATQPPAITVGQVRVQLLSDSLVRLEVKGARGFEDRTTFHIVNRQWPGVAHALRREGDEAVIVTGGYIVHVPTNAVSLEQVRVESPTGQTLYHFDGKLENSKWLPSPEDNPQSWSFADTPRLIPPAWGLTPAPASAGQQTNEGWDLGNDAPDVYVFVPGGDYHRLRRDFLKLTGPSEMPPLYALGAWDSRWYDYSEETALGQIEAYRSRHIPLDVLVVDTGWRVGASVGYGMNTNLFPDVARFFHEAHERDVQVMFNDHPEPRGTDPLAPEELDFRFNGLSGLLEKGLDVWWFDRNWMVSLHTPAPNLRKEVWGMRMYQDMTARVRPQVRPLIMANVDGVDNGRRNRAPDVAAHRFTFQWTGDTQPGFDFLRMGVENCVHAGVAAVNPYTSEDLGGHVANPTPEGYIRWMEYGALSPIYRPHCTHNLQRMPWTFGAQAEEVVRNYLNMRYRLLPVSYAACRENYETGEPLLRRLDLQFPEFHEAQREDEYLLGQSILVAPVLQGALQTIPASWFTTPDGQPGLQAEYFTNDGLNGDPALKRVDAGLDFNWGKGSPDAKIPNDHFSARWTGKIQVPVEAGDSVLSATSDDGVRVWLDDQLVIDNWKGSDSAVVQSSTVLKAGQVYALRVEYMELTGGALVRLCSQPVTPKPVARELWVPPGDWIDAWSGQVVAGPVMITNECPLEKIPIYVWSGSVLALAPEMQFTGEKPWSPVTLDIYPRVGETNSTTLYEDDTRTIGYRRGEFCKTTVEVFTDVKRRTVDVSIGKVSGAFPGALKERSWVLRVRRPANWPETLTPVRAKINGKSVRAMARLARQPEAIPFGDLRGAPDADVYEITLPAMSVHAHVGVEIGFGR